MLRYGDSISFSAVLIDLYEDKLVYASIQGMLTTLDPHTNFLEPEEYGAMQEKQRGSFYGLGIIISKRNGKITVITPIEGSPADRLGIRASWSQPIHLAGAGRVVGTISTIFDSPHVPDTHEQLVVETATNLVSIALEREQNQARLAHQALHDTLTGLPNRNLLLNRLDHALARRDRNGGEIAVLFCDLDRFKVVNDSMGHGVGDDLLLAVARRLGEVADGGDTVARFGGDEFVILLEDLPEPDHAQLVAERVVAALAPPFDLGGQEVPLVVVAGREAAGCSEGRRRRGDRIAWQTGFDPATDRACFGYAGRTQIPF